MKVRVELSIEIDVEAWDNTYGPSPMPGETRLQAIRRDVREHTLETVRGSAPYATGEVPYSIDLA